MKLLKLLLFPAGIIFGILVGIRRWLFLKNILPRTNCSVASIGVGNLSAGGTGKTPVSLYLIKLFEKNRSIGFISRGYQRKSKGLIEAEKGTPWYQLGDEPFLVKKRHPETHVISDGNRKRAFQYLIKKEPEVGLIIFDDVFQHLWIKPGFQILLTEYSRPFYKDFILPAGYLREFRSNARFCDALIVTKCPNILSPIERRHVEHEIGKYTQAKIYFSHLNYLPLRPVSAYFTSEKFQEISTNQLKELCTLGVCGIANPFSFEEYLRRNSNFSSMVKFPDHHQFTDRDVEKIKLIFGQIKADKKIIVVTEKDVVKLSSPEIIDEVKNLPMFVLPIEVKFNDKDQTEFEKTIKNYVEQNKGIR